jgi:hypothetical protein
MSIELESHASTADEYEHYRALSTSAVAGLIVGLLAPLAVLDWTLVAIPLIGIVVSALSLVKIRRHQDELTGTGFARAGLVLSLLFAVFGPARLTYDYVTELPPGYLRASYAELQPDEAQVGQRVPPSALALEGQKIFIKGYVYPGREKDGIRRFLLVRDQGQCCFGGNPKITDRILVTLDDPLRLTYASRVFKLGGTFHVEAHDSTIDDAKGGVYYHLKADYLQ